MRFPDKVMRIHYHLVQDPNITKAEYINTQKLPVGHYNHKIPSEEELKNFTFIYGSIYNSIWKINYNDEFFRGLKSHTQMIHT